MKERADKLLSDRGLVASRSQAKSLIEKGDVTVNGVVIKKASEPVDVDAEILVNVPLYVGRGAFKLEKALEEFKISAAGKICADIGASTGGFTEVLLMNGAQKVYAIDVGHGQLAKKLQDEPKVINLEGTNIKDLHELPEEAELAVMDLSFISITKVLANVVKLIRPGGDLIALIKPQFEAGRDRLPKDGVVKDVKLRELILEEVMEAFLKGGWFHHQTIVSPIEGKTGNVEFLSHFTKAKD